MVLCDICGREGLNFIEGEDSILCPDCAKDRESSRKYPAKKALCDTCGRESDNLIKRGELSLCPYCIEDNKTALGAVIAISTVITTFLFVLAYSSFSNAVKSSLLLSFFVAGGIWLVVFVICFAVYAGLYDLNSKKTIKGNIEKVLSTVEDFNVSQQFISKDYLSGIAIDTNSKKICFINRDFRKVIPRCQVFSHQDILEVEIVEDNNTIIKTSRDSQVGGAVVGGLLLGGVGAVIGGLSGKKTMVGQISRLYLKIIVNCTEKPVYTIDFINKPTGQEINKNDEVYKTAIEQANHWHALISILIKQADKDISLTQKKLLPPSRADELLKLSQLLEKGVITQEEFNSEKAKILSDQ